MMNVNLFENVKRVKTAKRRDVKVKSPTIKSSQENTKAQTSYDAQYIKDGVYHMPVKQIVIKKQRSKGGINFKSVE